MPGPCASAAAFSCILVLLLLGCQRSNPLAAGATVSSMRRLTDTINIGFLAEYSQMRVTLGGLPLAIEDVNKNPNLLPGKKLAFKPVDIGHKMSAYRVKPLRAMTQMREAGVTAFIGPDESCTTEALLASAWNTPMLSFKCSDPIVSNKSTFHTFARTLAPASKVSKSVISLLNAFHWNKFSIVVSSKPIWGSDVARAIQELAEARNFTISHFKYISDYIPTTKTLSQIDKIIEETYATTRIYVFIGEHIAMVDFVRGLQNRRLLESGDYIVVSVDDEIYDSNRRVNIMERIDICSKIKDYARKTPFLVPYHQRVFDNISVPIYGLHLYDSVMIYVRAITEVLRLGGDIYDGNLVMSHIFNRSYHSIQGFDVYIDSNGDAEGNYTVITLQNDVGSGASIGSLAKMSMQPVGFFAYDKNSVIPEFRYIKNDRPIQWLNGRPPLAEPLCGFHGELCPRKKLDWRYLVSGPLCALVVVVAIALLIKHYRYEQTLAGLLWKVDMKDVTVINLGEYNNPTNKNIFQICRQSILVVGEPNKRSFTNIALFRGNIVAMKKIHKKSVDITRSIRKELKLMREVRHENIINFIGASTDHGSVIIFTTYCARGSLEDVLANEDLHLDHMFISSLVSDILKGMIYLHDSEIISHGNLRSSNCLIDSRWVCQISDFGLHELKAGQEEPNKSELELKRALCMAPELLRDAYRPGRGSQKGDVYSFGILLYEMIGRKGPWGDTAYSKEEIIQFVKCPEMLQHGVFRPALTHTHLDIPDYIRKCLCQCWDEDPEVRPDIRLVRMHLKELQAGLKPNIFDNMLSIMEKYAYNLEGLVQERTNLLYEEKKKTDMLLYQMLPRPVAELLKRGDPVEAECFDCVTILFSDIVGFTELCTTSTPFEVVEMLNDWYTCCDSIISNYDVYKVETIGDAYMVVSGLPLQNGSRHAGEIASLALHLLETVGNLKIRHKPTETVQLRIGVHSGPCAAGVVGQKMPRYCLFGDTVNTASRMESTGDSMRIHISEATYQLLQVIGSYVCIERGLTSIKGKGDMRTYWLTKRQQPELTPDLISTVDTLDTYCSGPRESMEVSVHQYCSPASNNYRLGSCNCDTKCLYSRRSDDNVTNSHGTSEFPKVSEPAQVNCNQLCVCRLNSSQMFNNRGPRSAPSITFRL
uniref:Guanylate cyclase n=1 Tax=Drosophila melanogaster TaxID=7227 RepID=X2J5N3_DROME|nr:guanylyl cyclase at 32E, isoform G [Drosophila melanogaster]AHN54348.1 guanylyl cyclase at 32E, isoform G [Drosophila melanogaster]|eukprot:NP_001285834.1 guanyl cyclase at 32E, isoform G [Drosophila melanogaster]